MTYIQIIIFIIFFCIYALIAPPIIKSLINKASTNKKEKGQ